MLFVPSEPNRKFDSDLFGSNPFGFSYFFENEGYRAVWDRKKITDNLVRSHLPATAKLAKAMFGTVDQRTRWGRQIAPKRWLYETANEPISAGQGRQRYGDFLREREILKHLLGRGFARGTTDVPNEFTTYDYEKKGWRYNLIRSLRLDVDQDAAWLTQDRDAIMEEIRSEAEIARRLRLPYRVFRTGGRGHQAVIPTPFSLPHSLSSLLMWSIRFALEQRSDQYGSEPDADNLHSLMRLPGGVHGRSGEIGLWIDHQSGKLHALSTQAALMRRGFDYPSEVEDGLWTKADFKDPAVSLVKAMRREGIVQHHRLTRDEAIRILEDKTDNLIIETCLRAFEIASSVQIVASGPTENEVSEGVLSVEAEESTTHHSETENAPALSDNTTVPDPDVSVAYGTKEWAAQVWMEAWKPGEFWEWINMGGKRGILAAVVLFGKDDAEEALLNHSHSVPTSRYEQRAREFTIRSLWKTFGLKEFVAYDPKLKRPKNTISGSSDAEVETLAGEIVRGLRSAQPKGKWKDDLAHRIALVILIGLRDSPDGTLSISLRDLAATINERWPDEAPTNHMRIKEGVLRMTPGPKRLYVAFRRRQGATYRGEPDAYEAGPRLLKTEFGIRCRTKYMEALAREFGDDGDEIGTEVKVTLEPSPGDSVSALPESGDQTA